MPYDKYRNWSTKPTLRVGLNIKDQVLCDLAAATDETERLEILDSYEVYVERATRIEVADNVSEWLLNFLKPIVSGAIEKQLGNPMPIGRPRAATATKEE